MSVNFCVIFFCKFTDKLITEARLGAFITAAQPVLFMAYMKAVFKTEIKTAFMST
jgi:hypothetical protein